jgi:hypothetical protein
MVRTKIIGSSGGSGFVDLRYPSYNSFKGRRLIIGNVAKLVIKRNNRIVISTASSICSNYSNIPLGKNSIIRHQMLECGVGLGRGNRVV